MTSPDGYRDQARSLVEKGVDPRQQRRDEKLAANADALKTFEGVANEWYDFKAPRMLKAKKGGAAQSRRYLDKDQLLIEKCRQRRLFPWDGSSTSLACSIGFMHKS
ncbi:hypothetical protein [Pseudomonas helleri]|uniref:Integrase n=1 Tax=Pseudomonas helleri TaxID=1608996 RepID=A0A7X2C630_9PSED|nr:hypothetical protein [Pseudomonas helleri]MQT92481.1 hypothetical protein [Pseudomonas helleri]